ncbi:Aste57867_17042 [Aphanomyces stellatus]|uniref:Aste57867_17042 protein n=1 Tax=Aphanomyces stellatus TaxID=120398 RepID=A0A485L6V3_9STRA|nr:hypothetical protein As57867_016984 [Aphanomyces stellatus]VFT93803.1 Aste57867_17042 [Aphanomyces stellatus]
MGLGLAEQTLVRIIQGARGSFISPKIQVRRFPAMGLGVQAVEAIDEGEVVFTASHDVWKEYSAATARAEAHVQAPAFVERVDAYCGANKRMADAVLLATHIVLSDPSDVYLNSLPQNLDVPMSWSERRLDELRHCDVLDTIMNSRHFYRKMHGDLFGIAPMVSGIEFQWALSILMSRATSGKDQPFTLIPFFEWFNHSASPTACTHEYIDRDGAFVIRTTKRHAPHEQLFINYGDHSPATYLRHYGFSSVEDARMLDPVSVKETLSLHDLPDADPTKPIKMQLARTLGWPDSKAVPYTIHTSGARDAQALDFEWLRLFAATKEELEHRQRTPADVAWLESNTQRVQGLLSTLCTNRLAKYHTSAETDLDLLRNNDSNTLEPWLASCVNVRLGEKLVLRSFLDEGLALQGR